MDLWPLDPEGRVFFDPQAQNRIAIAIRKAATKLGVPIRWGGHFHGFKDMDRSHFELALHDGGGALFFLGARARGSRAALALSGCTSGKGWRNLALC